MLTRWDPFREMMIVRNSRGRRFDGHLSNADAGSNTGSRQA